MFAHERSPNHSNHGGIAMAVRQLNKLHVYHSLYRINKALHHVAYHIHELQESGLLPVAKMDVLRHYTHELKAEISHDVVDRMHEIEDSEMYRWEKTRIARENLLNPERAEKTRKGLK
jgi:hypothetical protein